MDDSSLSRGQLIAQMPVAAAGANGASELDLRRTKGELFSKLVERQQPLLQQQQQQMVAGANACALGQPSKTSSADDLANSSRAAGDLSRLAASCRKASSRGELGGELESSARSVDAASEPCQPLQEVSFSRERSKWYTNEEVAAILTSFGSHPEWQTAELQTRPRSGAVLLYSRERVRYRQDGYCWKKRKNGRTTREDHMKLKVQGVECIYGCYVHSALLPTFHRRCYWLLENPDIVLVHYLNQPPEEKGGAAGAGGAAGGAKMLLTFETAALEADTRRRWTSEEIVAEIGAVFGGISEIHHTLNINFPQASEPLQSARPLASSRDALDLGQVDGHEGLISDQMDTSPAAAADERPVLSRARANSAGHHHHQLERRPPPRCERGCEDEGDGQQAGAFEEGARSYGRGKSFNAGVNSKARCDKGAKNGRQMNNDGREDEDDGEADEDGEEDGEYEGDHDEDDDDDDENADDEMVLGGCGPASNENNDNNDNNNHDDDDDEDNGASNNIKSGNSDNKRERASNAAVTFQPAPADVRRDVAAPQPQPPQPQPAVKYEPLVDGSNVLLIDDNQDDQAGGGNFYESLQGGRAAANNNNCQRREQTSCRGQQSPCSPVTQIYNKIVDDIETYVLPLEPDQFNPSHQQQQRQLEQLVARHDLRHGPGAALASMDTCEVLGGGGGAGGGPPSELLGLHHRHHHHHHHAESPGDECGLFCAADDSTGAAGAMRRAGDMLLSDFNLASADAHAAHESGNGDGGELMLGIQSAGEQTACDEADEVAAAAAHSQQQLALLGEPDPISLFQCEADSQRRLCHQQRLEVKSTTSDTDALSRLSPIMPLVPRCNSTDNALLRCASSSLANQPLGAYQQHQQHHHASSHFLTQDRLLLLPLACDDDDDAAMNYDPTGGGLASGPPPPTAPGQRRLEAACSATSTEPSNSTSCSASPSSSPLLGASRGASSQLAFGGGGGCSGSVVSGESGIGSPGAYMKLPLQQRQNSEQQEPSNSVLSSLLPKALSLDGSDLSSSHFYNHRHQPIQQPHQQLHGHLHGHHLGPGQHHQHQHQHQQFAHHNQLHAHHHNHNHNHHHQQHAQHNNHHNHHHHQNLRASPLVGAHAIGHTRPEHNNARNLYAAGHYHGGGGGGGGKTSGNYQLTPAQPNAAAGQSLATSRQQHYFQQRPSVPSISPGAYSLDGSSSANKALALNGAGQYRSSLSSALQVAPLQQQQQQQQQHQLQQLQQPQPCRRLSGALASHAQALPILDYVPNWSPSSGGTKVLLVGNWTSLFGLEDASLAMDAAHEGGASQQQPLNGDSNTELQNAFSVLFDDLLVPATLIQNNVIRCHTPHHKPGFIALKVLHRDAVVSEQVLFEVRGAPEPPATANGCHGQRDALELLFQGGQEASSVPADGATDSGALLENQASSLEMDSTSIA